MSFLKNDFGLIGNLYGKNEIGILFYKRGRKKFKWIKDLDVKNKIVKLLEDYIGKFFYNFEVGKDFFNKVIKSIRLISVIILKFCILIY